MKTKKVLSLSALTLFSALFCGTVANAQPVLIPATAYEAIYPAGPTGVATLPTCHSFANQNYGMANYDTYLSAYNGRFVWMLTNVGAPSMVANQGSVAYPNCVNLNVGFVLNNSTMTNQAVVAYYKNAGMLSGHYYDVYNITALGVTLVSSTQISTVPFRTRISMDSHVTYGIVITWEDPSAGIYALTGLFGAFTAPVFLTGTNGMQNPDVAFSHVTGHPRCRFVYNLPTGFNAYDIYEDTLGYYTLNAALGSIAPGNEDINPVTTPWGDPLIASIDAPDHYTLENWSYTYSTDRANIFVRTMDWGSSLVPVTTNVVNGTLGNAAMLANETRPRLAYNKYAQSFHVGYFSYLTVGMAGQCYFTEQIDQSSTVLVSPADYELVAANSAFPGGAGLNSIAFSKHNDNTQYMYAVFTDNAGLHHTFHLWPNTASWKNGADDEAAAIQDNCLAHAHEQPTGINPVAKSAAQLAVGPNPFKSELSFQASESLKGEAVQVTLSDISGKVILQQEGSFAAMQEAVKSASGKLAAGSYFMNVSVESKGVQQNFKLIKTSGTN